MTPKEYLGQAYRLDLRISSAVREAEELREMSQSLSAIRYDRERVLTSPSKEAPFVKTLERFWESEEKVEEELNTLSALKEQIRDAIETVPNANERIVLKCRYVHSMSWDEISDKMNADRTTVWRWHGNALRHMTMPEDPITI
jgi:DNA-directed RNA polymerase specialized sigma24 family protein